MTKLHLDFEPLRDFLVNESEKTSIGLTMLVLLQKVHAKPGITVPEICTHKGQATKYWNLIKRRPDWFKTTTLPNTGKKGPAPLGIWLTVPGNKFYNKARNALSKCVN